MEPRSEPLVLDGIAALRAVEGTTLGVSRWVTVDQSMVDHFAKATGDDYWIHVDAERSASGPFGGTIAHGFLTLSLLPQLTAQIVRVSGFGFSVNYGTDKVRFPAPVRTGSRVRAMAHLEAVEETSDGVITRMLVTCEGEGVAKPHCVATHLQRYFASPP